jgi:hypothetical protein
MKIQGPIFDFQKKKMSNFNKLYQRNMKFTYCNIETLGRMIYIFAM